MFRSLFVVLLLLLVCCISGYTEDQVTQSAEASATVPTLKSSYYYFVSHLVDVNDTLVAITAAKDEVSGNYHSPVVLVTQISTNGGVNWITKPVTPSYNYTEEFDTDKRKSFLNSHRVAIALLEPFDKPKVLDESQKVQYPFHVVLKPLDVQGETSSLEYIPQFVEFPLNHGNVTYQEFVGSISSPILTMKSSTLAFPVQLTTSTGKITSGIVLFGPSDHHWVLRGVLPHEEIYNPAIVQWKGNLMMIAQHNSGYHRVYESTDLGNTWKESTETLSRVWVNSPVLDHRRGQNSFITATIDGKGVILFMQSFGSGAKNELNLWLTDNTRIYHVGLISEVENAITSSLFFKDDKLYCLYEAVERRDDQPFFLDLTSYVEKIKKVLKKWADQDTMVSKGRCCAGDKTCLSSEDKCKYPVPTNGLVGYLSGNIADDKWNDEYLCVNATIKGSAAKTSNGLTFKGASGAIWPVSTSGPAREYYFTNNAFTLVALVTIHKLPTESSPLLGVRLNNSKKEILLGVSYNNNNTWTTTSKAAVRASVTKWELGKTYSVVLTFKEGDKGSVYVDGKLINPTSPTLVIPSNEEISHFYFGVDSGVAENTHVTITNVMLYNRVLSDKEIAIFLKNKMNINLPKDLEKEISEKSTTESHSPVTETQQNPENQNSTPETGNEGIPVKESQKHQEKDASQNATTTAADADTNDKENSLQQANNLNATKDINTRQNNTTDGTVCVYGYGLPLLLLGVCVVAAVLP